MDYAKPQKFTKDDTPVRKYSLTLSDRDIKSLNSLKSRNFSISFKKTKSATRGKLN